MFICKIRFISIDLISFGDGFFRCMKYTHFGNELPNRSLRAVLRQK